MTDMREAVAMAIYLAYAQHPEADWRAVDDRMKAGVWYPQAEAALSLMQPEIDRRVAEERAKLLERLREPTFTMIDAGQEARLNERLVSKVWKAMLAQFEKENSHD
jgi:hypothetical protein